MCVGSGRASGSDWDRCGVGAAAAEAADDPVAARTAAASTAPTVRKRFTKLLVQQWELRHKEALLTCPGL